jgi:hypothetical protein
VGAHNFLGNNFHGDFLHWHFLCQCSKKISKVSKRGKRKEKRTTIHEEKKEKEKEK